MNILITGADSFIGSYIIPKLITECNELFLIGGRQKYLIEKYPAVEHILSHQGLEVDILTEECNNFKPDIVLHLAGYSTAKDDFEESKKLIDANILFLNKLCISIKNCSVKMFINTGSFSEYYKNDAIDPAYLYSVTKTVSRLFLDYFSKVDGYKYCTICPYSVYGGIDTRKKLLDYIYESFFSEKKIQMTSGEQVLDFIHVEDLANLYVKVIENYEKVDNQITINAGTGSSYSVRDIIKKLEVILDMKANVDLGALSYRKRDIMYANAPKNDVLTKIGWSPKIDIMQGLKIFVEAHYNG